MKLPFLSLFVLVLLASCSPLVEEKASVKKPNPEIIAKFQEIVKVRERQSEEQRLMGEMGKGKAKDLGAAELALAEARIALLKEQGRAELVEKELRNLVKLLKKHVAREEALAEEDRRSTTELGELRVALLEAEVRLLQN